MKDLSLLAATAIIVRAAQYFLAKINVDQLSSGLPSKNLEMFHLETMAVNAGLTLSPQTGVSQVMCFPAITISDKGELSFIYQPEPQRFTLVNESGVEYNIDQTQFHQLNFQQVWLVTHNNILDKRSTTLHQHIPSWIQPILREVKPFYRSLLVGSLVINVLAIVIPLFTMNVYDRVVPNAAIDTLWVLAAGAFIAIIFDWLLKQSRTKLADAAGRQIDVRVSSNLFSKVMGMRLENRPLSAGAYAKHVQEFDSVREFITSATLVSAIDLPFTLLFLLLIGWLGGAMVFIPLVAMFVIITLGFVLQRKLSHSVEESSKYASQRQAYLVEFLNQIIELKQCNSEGKAQGLWEQTVSHLSDWQNQSRETANTLSHSVMSIQQLTTIGLIVSGVYQIQLGNISMGALIAMVMISGRAGNAINQLSTLILKYKQTKTAIDSVKEVLALPQESQPNTLSNQSTITGKITVKDISFLYPEQKNRTLDTVSFSVKPGEKIGFYGKVGSGKSTLLALLAGQYKPSQGQVFYDDIEARQWSLSTLRNASAWVAQTPTLFYGSVLDNVTENNTDIDSVALAKALTQSGVSQFIDRLELGLESQVGEFGRNLSGGQRQSIAIARSLLRQPQLMFLDEPTSAMDDIAERHLIHTLKNLHQVNLFIASHKQAVLMMCDKVVVLDKGKVVRVVPPTQLFSAKTSRLRSIKTTTK